jgi:hypothetical protein
MRTRRSGTIVPVGAATVLLLSRRGLVVQDHNRAGVSPGT